MSSNWTVVVFTQMVTQVVLSLSLSLSLLVSAIYIYHKATDDVCAVVCLRPSLFVVLDVVRVWCVGLVVRCSSSSSSSFCPQVFFLFVVQKLDWKKLHYKKIFTY